MTPWSRRRRQRRAEQARRKSTARQALERSMADRPDVEALARQLLHRKRQNHFAPMLARAFRGHTS